MFVTLVAGNYAVAGLNFYFWASGAEYGEINLGIGIFCFGVAQLATAVEGWKHQ